MTPIVNTSNTQFIDLPADVREIIFLKTTISDLSRLMQVSKGFRKDVQIAVCKVQRPLDRFLEILQDSLKDVMTDQIEEQFRICKEERKRNDVTSLRVINKVDLFGIKEALTFLVSKLSDEQLCEAWIVWGKEYHDRVLSEFLANHYFDRLVPSSSLEDLDDRDREEYVEDVLRKLTGFTPPTLGFISVGYEKKCLDHDAIHNFIEEEFWPVFPVEKFDEFQKIAPHLFSDGPLVKCLWSFVLGFLFSKKKKNLPKALEILDMHSNIIYKDYVCISPGDYLWNHIHQLYEAGRRFPVEFFPNLKKAFESRDQDLTATVNQFMEKFDEIMRDFEITGYSSDESISDEDV